MFGADKLFGVEDKGYMLIAEAEKVRSDKYD
jgi:hypothetical protein